jgi:lysyl-tRNA synthetase class 2
MTPSLSIIVRVLDVLPAAGGSYPVVVAIADRQREIKIAGSPPAVGDLLELTGSEDSLIVRKVGGTVAGPWHLNGDGMRWRHYDAGGRSRMDVLRDRHVIRLAVRAYLDNEGFIEIDVPLLVHGTTPDAGIPSFAVADRYLVTSTEYQLKRMIVGGFDRIYSLTQNFRAGDTGSQNNPEFTMLEWGRVGVGIEIIEQDVERFVNAAHRALGGDGNLVFQGHRIDLTPPWPRLSVAAAFSEVTGYTVTEFSVPTLRSALQAAGLAVRHEMQEDQVFLFTILLDHVQAHLGFERPVFLRDWPSFLTSSAAEQTAGILADRSELFVAGIELADGFPSLTNYQRQQETFREQLARRQIEGSPPVMVDSSYLEALRLGLPPGAGMALGFDRLVMLLTDQTLIRPVLAFAWDEV